MGIEPSGLTRKQEALVAVVVDGGAQTVTHAGKLAGYSHRSTTSHALRLPTVQGEIARRRNAKADTVARIRLKAIGKLGTALDSEDDAVRLAQVTVAMATVEEKLGAEEQVAATDVTAAGRLMLRAWLTGYRQAISAPHLLERVMATRHRIDPPKLG